MRDPFAMDAFYVAIALILFGLTLLVVRMCDRV
jgi:hypothetical protein